MTEQWVADHDANCVWEGGKDGPMVADVWGCYGNEVELAARIDLIAAAPETKAQRDALLAALKRAVAEMLALSNLCVGNMNTELLDDVLAQAQAAARMGLSI